MAPAQVEELRWLEAAAQVAQRMPLFASPLSPLVDGTEDVDRVITRLAREVDGPAVDEAQSRLDRWDESPRPADLPAPSDVAIDRYAPEIVAGFFLGFAMGARMTRAVGGAR